MSAAEVERLRIATFYLEQLGLPCWVATLGDGLLDLDERTARRVITQATSIITQLQDRAGLPQFWVCVLESTRGLHGNIIFVATDKVAAQFSRSCVSKYLGKITRGARRKGLKPIQATREDWAHVVSYHAKERTLEAEEAYGHLLGDRASGAHRLGRGGGDRVRLSRSLGGRLLDLGLIEPYRRTNSRKLTSVTADTRPLERVDHREATAPAEHGAILAPPPAPVDERRDVTGIVAAPAREASGLGSRLPTGGRPILLPRTERLEPHHPGRVDDPDLDDPRGGALRPADTRKMLIELHGEGGVLSFEHTLRNPQNGQGVRSGRSSACSPHPLSPWLAQFHDQAKCFPLKDLRPSAMSLMRATNNKIVMSQ